MKKILSILLISMMIIAQAGMVVMAQGEPAAVTDLAAYSSYKGVALEWSPVAGASSYAVYRDGALVASNVTTRSYVDGSKMYCYVRTDLEGGANSNYYVVAKNGNGQSAPSNVVTKNSVAPLLYNVTFRNTRTLTAHDGSGARHTFRSGERVKAHSFKFGQYIFRYGGHIYHVNYYNGRKYWAYTAKNNGTSRRYDTKEAEYFANHAHVNSNTKWLVWASLYSQRCYVFYKQADGRWHLCANLKNKNGVKGSTWQISSGKATTPSPAGNFTIYKKQRSKNGVNYWNYYHSQTSLHGRVRGQDLLEPRSEGCIRQADCFAKTLYDRVPVGTRVIVY